MKEILSAKKAAEAKISKPKLNLMRRKVREFLKEKTIRTTNTAFLDLVH